MPCPICGRRLRRSGHRRDDRYGEPGRFPLLLCPDCGHASLGGAAPGLDPARLYGERYPRRDMAPGAWQAVRRRGGLAGWLAGERGAAWAWVPADVAVLDIGAGSGEALAWHRGRGCRVAGLDPDPAAARIACEHALEVRAGAFRDGLWPTGSFDAVTMDQVIEHLPDPLSALRAAARLLRPGGRLVISTPNGAAALRRILGRRWQHWHAPYHLHIFSPRSLALAVRQAGLVPVARTWTTSGAWPFYQVRHLLEPSPREGAASPFWSPSAPRPRLDRLAGGVIGRLVERSRIATLAMRALDACRRGDNQLVVAENRL